MRFFLVALSLFVQFGLLDHTVPIIGYRYHAFRASAYFYQLELPLPQPSASDPQPQTSDSGIFFVALYNMTIFPMSLRCQAQARKCDTANNYSASAHL